MHMHYSDATMLQLVMKTQSNDYLCAGRLLKEFDVTEGHNNIFDCMPIRKWQVKGHTFSGNATKTVNWISPDFAFFNVYHSFSSVLLFYDREPE